MKSFKIALQLYSIREDMERDMDAALGKVKEMGYDYVEFAGYFGKTAQEVKGLLDKYNLTCISVHQVHDIFLKEPKDSIDYLKTIGAKYCAIPWMGKENHKGSGSFEQTVTEIAAVGKALKDAGIQLLYHNHDFEFDTFEGKFLLDWLYEAIPSDILATQIDTCWVRFAGYNPADYIRKYKGRSPIVHLKDFTCTNFGGAPVYALIDAEGRESKRPGREESGFTFKPLGKGIQDFSEIIRAAEEAGTEILVVEQDQSPDMPAMEAAKISLDYLKKLGL